MDVVDTSIALLIIRVVFGVSLAAHGAQKLFGWWGGPGLAGFAGWLGSMNMRAPKAAALMAGLSEFVGGLLFAAGLLTPLAAVLIVSVMLTAIATVHAKAGFFVTNGGWEYNTSIIAAAVAVAASGAGRYSLDDALDISYGSVDGWVIALGVLGLGIVATAFNLGTRTSPAASAPTGDDAATAA